jgi:hypothetical protein
MPVDSARWSAYPDIMTNRIAIGIAIVLAVFLAVDLAFNLGATLFLARRFLALIEWLAFWR